jgi:hypothetical protein
MVFYDEVDRDEICRRFGVAREYLRVLVHRAKSRLREGLVETGLLTRSAPRPPRRVPASRSADTRVGSAETRLDESPLRCEESQ